VTTPERPISADDLEVSLAVRKDLGPQHDPAVVAEFLDRVGDAIDRRVDKRLAAKRALPGLPADGHAGSPPGLGIVSLVMGIPITAIVLGNTNGGVDGIVGLVVAWAGIAGVNLAYARRR
jgi:hypothetical protein